MNDLVSIITPSYNTGDFISETIKSVINQDYKNWELIIVDDCSEDNSIDIIKTFRDNRIRLIVNSTNKGAAYCRNHAIEIAKGEWIAFLDSDDVWYSKKLSTQIRYMKIYNISFSYTEYTVMNDSSRLLGKKISGPKYVTYSKMRNYCYLGCLTVMYRRSLGNVKITNISKNNDYAIWLRLSHHATCVLLPEVLAVYRKRANSISSVNKIDMAKHLYKLWRYDQHKGFLVAILLTLNNLLFGLMKHIFYEKKTSQVGNKWNNIS
jgi:glycosyltransferase involved in cell wall biosynthesis